MADLYLELACHFDTAMMILYRNPRLSFEQAERLAKIRLKRKGPYGEQ